MNFTFVRAIRHSTTRSCGSKEVKSLLPLIEALDGESYDGDGASCYFYKLNSRWGIKFCRNKSRALKSYTVHEYLSREATKHVPEVFGPLMIFKVGGVNDEYSHFKNDQLVYGYVVRICKTLNPGQFSGVEHRAKCLSSRLARTARGLNRLTKYICDLFIDVHSGNVGYLGQRLVWIDFSI